MTERFDESNEYVREICDAVRDSEKYAERLAFAASEAREVRYVSFRLTRHHDAPQLRMLVEGRLIDYDGRLVDDIRFDEAIANRIVDAARKLVDAMPPGWHQAGSLMFDMRHDFVQPTWL